MIVVVDASVIAKWYVDEDHTADAEVLIDSNFDLAAPELAIAEVGNILWKKYRRGELSKAESERLINLFLEEAIDYHGHSDLLRGGFDLATSTGQTVMDCLYLELAIALDSKLVTADRKFFRAMRSTVHKDRIIWIENVASLN